MYYVVVIIIMLLLLSLFCCYCLFLVYSKYKKVIKINSKLKCRKPLFSLSLKNNEALHMVGWNSFWLQGQRFHYSQFLQLGKILWQLTELCVFQHFLMMHT
jgi:hypothetical protein